MSDEPTSESPAESQLDRRELLKKAGQVGAGAVAAGTLAGGAKAATSRTFATPRRFSASAMPPRRRELVRPRMTREGS